MEIRSSVAQSMGLRIAILLVAILLIAAIILLSSMTDADRQALALNLAYAAGYCAPAIVLGAIYGWIKYSLRSWGISTMILLVITAFAVLAHNDPKFVQSLRALL